MKNITSQASGVLCFQPPMLQPLCLMISLLLCLLLFSCISDSDWKPFQALKQPSLLYSFSCNYAWTHGSRNWGWWALLQHVQIHLLNVAFTYDAISSTMVWSHVISGSPFIHQIHNMRPMQCRKNNPNNLKTQMAFFFFTFKSKCLTLIYF